MERVLVVGEISKENEIILIITKKHKNKRPVYKILANILIVTEFTYHDCFECPYRYDLLCSNICREAEMSDQVRNKIYNKFGKTSFVINPKKILRG